MFEALALARGAPLRNWGRHERILKTIARMEVLIIDDWGLAVLTAPERRDLLEILEDRHGRASPGDTCRCGTAPQRTGCRC